MNRHTVIRLGAVVASYVLLIALTHPLLPLWAVGLVGLVWGAAGSHLTRSFAPRPPEDDDEFLLGMNAMRILYQKQDEWRDSA